MLRPDPPPPSLAAACDAGPEFTDASMTLAEVLRTVQAREKAAAQCRERHRLLAEWAAGVSRR